MEQPLILITGANGQLGQEFKILEKSWPQFTFLFAGKMELDVAIKSWVMEYIEQHKPSAVINCAAYTNVERAEDEPEAAHVANTLAPEFIAEACHEHNALLVHISTDYVFDGKRDNPYTEEDDVQPLNQYGISKLEGERRIDAVLERYFTLRTSWLYSTHGHNFFKTMLRLARERGELNVVSDQYASPTYARLFADDILRLLEKVIIRCEHVDYGLYHYTQTGIASWFDFAQEIIRLSEMNVPVHPVLTSAFPTKAVRPIYSKLDTAKWTQHFGIPLLDWQSGVAQCMKDMK